MFGIEPRVAIPIHWGTLALGWPCRPAADPGWPARRFAELTAGRAALATPRLTAIVDAAADQDDESLIEPGQMVVTITRDGFIKRTPLETFRAQNRGGRGVRSPLDRLGDKGP